MAGRGLSPPPGLAGLPLRGAPSAIQATAGGLRFFLS